MSKPMYDYMKTYELSQTEKTKYASIIIINKIVNTELKIRLPLKDDDEYLRPSLDIMYAKGLIQVLNNPNPDNFGIIDNYYTSTSIGEELLNKFYDRYFESLKISEVFSAVDLKEGEFAFKKFFEFESEGEWKEYLNEPRFEDMRVAVAELRSIDPIESIFMSFISEGRFECDTPTWQFELLTGMVWTEMLEIVNSNIHADQIEPEEMENMVRLGSEIMMDLIKQEIEINNAKIIAEEEYDTIEETTVTTVTYEEDDIYCYYEPYYDDPYYVSPLWAVPLILLF